MQPDPVLMAGGCVLLSRRGHCAWISINRPDVGNLVNPSVIEGIAEALDALELDDDIRAVAIGGVGADFCKGAEVGALGQVDAFATRTLFGERMQRTGAVFNRIDDYPKPVIAAVAGQAVAAGLEIVLACDLVVATTDALFGEGHASYGQLPGGGGSIRLPRMVGPSRAKYMLFTGRTIPAQTFERWGVVHDVVEESELISRVDQLAGLLARTHQR